MANSINSKAKEYYDNDDTGGSLNSNLKDFLKQQGATGKSINTLWRDYAYGEGGTSLNTRLRNLWGTSGSLMKRWKETIGLTWDELKAFFNFRDIKPDFLLDGSTSFSGSSQYIDCGTGLGNALGDNYAGDLTVSMWFKADVTSGDDGMFEIGNFTNSGTGDFALRMKSNTLSWMVNAVRRLDVSYTNTSSWSHVVGVYDSRGADFTKLYLNAESVGTPTGTFPSASDLDLSGLKTTIGGYYGSPYTFDGKIANVGIWNRALSASEVESIYWRGSHSELQNTELTNLVSWYDLDSTSLGSELVVNGTFDSDVSGWAQTNLTATYDSGTAVITNQETVNDEFLQAVSLDEGVGYEVSATISNYSAGTSTVVLRYDNTALTSGGSGGDRVLGTIDGNKTITATIYGTSGSEVLRFRCTGTGSATNYTIDNVSVKAIQTPDAQGSNEGNIVGATVNSDSYSGESPFKPRIQDKAAPKMAVQLADGSTSFDGTNDYVDLSNVSNFANLTQGTISAWFKTPDLASYRTLVSGSDRSDGSSECILLLTNLGKIRYVNQENASVAIEVDTTSAFDDNEWHHVALTVDGTGNKIYVDGSLQPVAYVNGSSSTQKFFNDVNDIDSLKIGANEDNGGTETFFNGSMANVAIHSSALTQSQVQELMFAEKYSGLSTDLKNNLISWYDMGSSSNPHNDLEGSNHGTNNGATVNTGYTYSPHGVVDPLNFGEVYSGRALSFDGSNDYTNCGSDSSLDNIWNGGGTLSAWIFPESDGEGDDARIAEKRDTGNGWTFTTREESSGRCKLRVFINFSSTNGVYTSGADVTINAWNHVAVAYDSSGAGSSYRPVIYINGSVSALSATTDSVGTADSDASEDFTIGGNKAQTRIFDGKINHVKAFNNILTQDQVQELYTKPETVLPTGVSASNLKLDLPMQEGSGSYIYDGSGNQNHGTITGATFVTGEEYGYQASLVRSNTPMIFDGNNDYIDFGNGTALDITSNLSMSLWVKINDGSSTQFLMGRDNDAQRNWELGISSNKLFFGIFSSNSNQGAGGLGNTLSDNVWYHIVATYDGSNQKTYVNGSLTSTTSGSGSIDNDNVSLTIGARPNGDRYFNGIINEVGLWNVALDADAVTALYNSGVPLLPTSDSGNYDNSNSLVGYWRNDGNTTWTDRSTNSNDGTANGSPVTIVIPEGSTSGRDSQGYYLSDTTSTSNNGLRMYGGAEIIHIQDSNIFHLGTQDFTFEFWAKYNETSTTRGLFNYFKDVNNRYHFAHYSNLEFYSNLGGSAQSTATTHTRDLNWHHYVITKESNTMKIYVDTSVIVTNSSFTQDINYTGGTFYIGVRTDDGSDFSSFNVDGAIDEFRIYHKALSSSEVLKNYNSGKSSHQ